MKGLCPRLMTGIFEKKIITDINHCVKKTINLSFFHLFLLWFRGWGYCGSEGGLVYRGEPFPSCMCQVLIINIY